MSASDDALAYVRRACGVPARRGQRVLYGDRPGTITGGHNAHLWVRLDQPRAAQPETPAQLRVLLHPTWEVQYLQVLWRCTRCGKWSHAKRRPKWHAAYTSTEPADEAEVIEFLAGSYSHMSGEGDSDQWTVKCGPFERWEARQVEAA